MTLQNNRRKQIEELTQRLTESEAARAHMQDERDTAFTHKNEFRRERDAANEREKTTRTQFEDLKTRLYNAEIENARLRGYLSRVHEADVARDGLVEIEDAQGKRLVPKWAPPQHLKPSIDYAEQNDGYDIMTGRRKPTTHWTSY